MEITKEHMTGVLIGMFLIIAFLSYTAFVYIGALENAPVRVEEKVIYVPNITEKIVPIDTQIRITKTDNGEIIVHPLERK